MSCFTWQQRNVDGWRFVGFMKDWILKNTGEESLSWNQEAYGCGLSSGHQAIPIFRCFFNLTLIWVCYGLQVIQDFFKVSTPQPSK